MNNKGFTLIEVLIALTIASVISLGFFKIVNITIKTNAKNEKDINSLNLAQSEVESLRAQIKSGSGIIIDIDDELHEFIEIDKKNSWVENKDGLEILKINDEKYQGENGNGDKDSSILKYKRTLDKDNNTYIVNLRLSREVITNKQTYNSYLYNISLEVALDNEYISGRRTVVSTKILENS